MTHLGERLSALVDGELDGAERDKATAHLARCEQCRAEAASLRDLKRQLRSLAAESPAVVAHEAGMTRRLMEMTGIGAAPQPRLRRLRVLSRPPRGLRPPGPASARPGRPARSARSARSGWPGGARMARRHGRYLALGAVTIVVGLGTAAFSVGGGGDAAPGPRITPQMQLYSEEHAITTGDVPFAGVPGSVEGPGVLPTTTSTGDAAQP